MPKQTFSITFEGYYRETTISSISSKSGIYCVYIGIRNENEQPVTVTLKSLIYIGQAEDIKVRLLNHDRLDDWAKRCAKGETIHYSSSEVSLTDLTRIEAALINHHKPALNNDYLEAFPFDETEVITSGRNKFLSSSFVVRKQ